MANALLREVTDRRNDTMEDLANRALAPLDSFAQILRTAGGGLIDFTPDLHAASVYDVLSVLVGHAREEVLKAQVTA